MSEPARQISMDMERFRSLLLDSVGVALAVVEPEQYRFLVRNVAFIEWFPTADDNELTLLEVLPTLDRAAMEAELDAGRDYRIEVEIKPKRRVITLAIELHRAVGPGRGEIMVQCQNISKIKELEYMIESYSKMIERQNRDLRKEKERVERLLLNIMPQQVYEEWKQFGVTTPQRFEEASVLMLDFVGFTEMAVSHEPTKLIAELNDIFTSFDRIVEQFGCERLKTIGDAYIAVSGMPESNPEHARNIARVALRFIRYLKRRNAMSEFNWEARIGINSGPVIGSVVGVQKYVYDIFGPGMNLAARLEPLCGPMEILLTGEMHDLIQQEFRMTDRGEHEIRGFGRKQIYRLENDLAPANDSHFY
ncbi:adenylate/guanylate cyclase domain-containing protein [Oceanibacterium hippocampi]|uniref:Adenylate cyclase n=1 Tax=Oceanibacterium hippocampi TaxID=745714 RepID=A0A1Y5RVJ7_9PROT|nr:adenylate/guanylate cyclase domain-containing protein [Oceanibacterium hippocampi]SLN26421.1 Adenylate cyclase [Oceanibacterium hippocampi]